MPRRKTETENDTFSHFPFSCDVNQQLSSLVAPLTQPSPSEIDYKQRSQNPEELKSHFQQQKSLPLDKKDPIRVLTFNSKQRSVHVAVEGCCHGELTKIYNRCREHDDVMEDGEKIDFLICCGDFQCTRTQEDMDSMAVPEKFKTFGDFPKYCGDSIASMVAPYLTIFIGGNHEASNVLFQQYYGGFVAPNIYYMGHSGVIEVCGLMIAGLSGIWKNGDERKPYPVPPYNGTTTSCHNSLINRCAKREGRGQYRNNSNEEAAKRSAYHIRTHEISKLYHCADLLEMKRTQKHKNDGEENAGRKHTVPSQSPLVDIFISHDWPVGITDYGDVEQLLRVKPFFREDIQKQQLGNPHTLALLKRFRPQYWFAAHLHCYFYAKVEHPRLHCSMSPSFTEFVALDKCILLSSPSPTRRYIAYYDIFPRASPDGDGGATTNNTMTIKIPYEWLRVCASAKPLLDASFGPSYMSDMDRRLENLTVLMKYPADIASNPNIELQYPDGSGKILAEVEQLLKACTQSSSATLSHSPWRSANNSQKRERGEEQNASHTNIQQQSQKEHEDDNNCYKSSGHADFVLDC
eukprot:Tbor_TRINITY_DN5104_c0_g1::TRINITY_DN5104_c0_g1_i1::g.25665::m.25665/K18328/DBR1; lariat debranching enzyme